jgi:hypothetical protein
VRLGVVIAGIMLFVLSSFIALAFYGAALITCTATTKAPKAPHSVACTDHWVLVGVFLGLIVMSMIVIVIGALQEPVATTEPGSSVITKCPRCGTFYPDPAPAYCSNCGGPVAAPESPGRPPPSTG